MSMSTRQDLEEERRLFYVAVTRAEKRATLSFAATRFRYGNMNYCEPSRFIGEIPENLIDSPALKSSSKRELASKSYELEDRVIKRKLVKAESAGSTLTKDQMSKLIVGTKVAHERFGSGEIVGLEGDFPNKKATVSFKGIGKKQLLLKFAKLQLIE